MKYHSTRYDEEGTDALTSSSWQMSGRRRPRPSSFNRSRSTDDANQASSNERPALIIPSSSRRSGPPAVVIAPSIDHRATENIRSNNNYNRKPIFFGLLVAASVLYTDSPLSTSVRAVYDLVSNASDTSTANNGGAAGSAGVGSAPAFSTSHSREMKLFGGDSSDDSNDARRAAALAKFEAATAPIESREKRGGGRGRRAPRNGLQNTVRRVRNGKRRPRLAHARDPTYVYEQPSSGSSESTDRQGSDAVLHPRERVLTRPTDDGESVDPRDATRGVSSKPTQAENAEATGRRKAISRFVFQEDPAPADDGAFATSSNMSQPDGRGSNLIMAMIGIIVGLGAVVSLAVLLFLSDQPFQVKRQHGRIRAESVAQHRRSTSGGSSSNTSTWTGSASIESIDEKAANDDEEKRGMAGVDRTRRRR